MPTFSRLLNQAAHDIQEIAQESNLFEAQQLLLDAFDMSKADFISSLHEPVTDDAAIKTFRTYIKKRKIGMPLSYILGHAAFLSHKYICKPGVLIPRPETELLVSKLIQFISSLNEEVAVFELGYGSGVIPIELRYVFNHIDYYGWDINPLAYQLAKKNAKYHHFENLSLQLGDFFDDAPQLIQSINKPFIIVSNPPYVDSEDLEKLDFQVKEFEPLSALDGGEKGLRYYKHLLSVFNKQPLAYFFEIGIKQKAYLQPILDVYNFTKIQFYNDFHSIPRILEIHR